MENLTPPENPTPNMEFTPMAITHMGHIRKWTYFFAIIGFVLIGLMVLFAMIMGTVFSSIAGDAMPIPTYLFSVIYLLFALLYFFPIRSLYRFSVQAKKGLAERNSLDMESALGNLRAHYTFLGYLMVIVLIIYGAALAIIGTIALFI